MISSSERVMKAGEILAGLVLAAVDSFGGVCSFRVGIIRR